MTSNLFFALASGRKKNPDHLLVLEPDGASISYGDFFADVARAGHLLRAYGIQPGDRVAVLACKSIGVLELYLACLSQGVVFLPMNPDYTNTEIEFFLCDAEPRLLVVGESRQADLRSVASKAGIANILTLNPDESGSLYQSKKNFSRDECIATVDEKATAALLYTSGTTGKPKGVQLSNKALLTNAKALNTIWRFTSADTLLHPLPLYHLHGLFVAFNVLLLGQGTIMFMRQFDSNAIIRQMPLCTAMMGVPTHYARLLDNTALDQISLDHFRLFISGSAPLLEDTHDEWKRRTGHTILERYGMTEASILTSNPLKGKRLAGSAGLPLPGVDLRIWNHDKNRMADRGEIGSVEVRSPGLFSGYWNKPELTAQEFTPDGYFITGDLGKINSDGYLTLEGRDKDLIITGGLNVYPKEVEIVIDSIPGIKESAVVGVPHPDFGEGVVAVIVGDNNCWIAAEDIIRFTKTRLAPYKCPKAVFHRDELPRNTMLKIQKSVLRDDLQATFAS